MSSDLSEQKQQFEGGATRSVKTARFDLVPGCAERRLAERYGLGAVKHGDNNWRQGGAEFIKGCVNHMQAHLADFKDHGNKDDDNLAAILWGAAALTWFEENKPEEFAKAFPR